MILHNHNHWACVPVRYASGIWDCCVQNVDITAIHALACGVGWLAGVEWESEVLTHLTGCFLCFLQVGVHL